MSPSALSLDRAAEPVPSIPDARGPVATQKARTAMVLAATALGVPLDAVLADHRCTAPVATARQVAMYLAHVELGLPQADVARAFQRDRSTVAHACRRVEDMRDHPVFDADLVRLATCARFALRS